MNEIWASCGQNHSKDNELSDDFTNSSVNNPSKNYIDEVFHDEDYTTFDPIAIKAENESHDVHLSQFGTQKISDEQLSKNIQEANILDVDNVKKQISPSLPIIYPIKLYYPAKKHAMVIRQGKKKEKSGIEYQTMS